MSTSAPRRRFGFAHRVAALFAVVALSLIVLGVVVSRRVDSMRNSVHRLAEEQRETGSSMYLLHHIRMLQIHAAKHRPEQWIAATPELEELRFHCDQALATLSELSSDDDGKDPSEHSHELHEESLYGSLRAGLFGLRKSLAADGLRAPAVSAIDALHHTADVLNDEVHTEEQRATDALMRDATRLRSAVAWTSAAAMVVLVLVLWLVQRSVVRPLLELRRGAARIAAGELGHRVDARSGDEVGELASEFNYMAEELAAARTDLEQRVEERTNEFLRAARLAGLGTMAAGIAHEINNPLASIASCAEGLSRRLRAGEVDPQTEREYLEIIAKEAYRAHGITSRLLEFARSEPGPTTTFSPRDVLSDIEVLMQHRLAERRLELNIQCDADAATLRGRPDECKQVLLNLLHNAVDASPEGGAIQVRCRRDGERMLLEVEDQGPGIAPDVARRAFVPFFTTKAPGKGTGLGLAIVDRIVASHGGTVDALDTGHGALFRVSIPIEGDAAA